MDLRNSSFAGSNSALNTLLCVRWTPYGPNAKLRPFNTISSVPMPAHMLPVLRSLLANLVFKVSRSESLKRMSTIHWMKSNTPLVFGTLRVASAKSHAEMAASRSSLVWPANLAGRFKTLGRGAFLGGATCSKSSSDDVGCRSSNP